MTPTTVGARLPQLCALAVVSGFCAVAYQMAWLRLLRLVFGASTAANAAVLAIFMGGLGFGGLWLGRRADRSDNPLALYAKLELGIGISAGLTTVLIALTRSVYLALGGTTVLGWVGGNAVRLMLAVVVLGVPTFLMGGTLPAIVRVVEESADRGRRMLGVLYGVNTLGAVSGAVVTTFFGIELLGTNRVILVAALLNLLVGVTARSWSRAPRRSVDRSGRDRVESPSPIEERPSVGDESEGPRRPAVPVPLVLVSAVVVGFVFFWMELVWYRMLAPLLGGTSYSFGVILAVALLGIGLGGLLYGLGARTRRPSLRGFTLTVGLEAVALAVPLALGDRIAVLAYVLRDLGVAGFAALVVGWFLLCAAVVLPASVIAGYQFPLLVALLGEGRRQVGAEVGLTYAFNTLGSIVGAVAGGFLLVPGLGALGSWRGSVLLLVGLALCVAIVSVRREGARPGWSGVVAAVIAAGLLLATGPTAFWRHSGIGAGRLSAPNDPAGFRGAVQSMRSSLVWEKDGRESSVAVSDADGYSFIVNGKSDGNVRGDAPTAVMLGMVGAALHPSPGRIAVIGLGTGESAGWLAEVPSVERVDVIELEPAIAEVARLCRTANFDVLEHPKVELHYQDGREFLLTARKRYDLVVSEPSNPYRAGISSLFTAEFYDAVEQRLEEDGLLLQWLQGYEIDGHVLRTAMATVASVFPHVELWQVHAVDLLIVAGRQPFDHDLERIGRFVASYPMADALRQVWGVSGVEGLYAGFLAGSGLADELLADGDTALNVDDRPVIEFGFVRNLGQRGSLDLDQLRQVSVQRGWGAPLLHGGALDPEAVAEARSSRARFLDQPTPPSSDPASPAGLREQARWLSTSQSPEAVVEVWQRQDQAPRYRADRVLVAAGVAEAAAADGERYLDLLAEVQPVEASALRGVWLLRQDRFAEAARALIAAFEAYREDPWPVRGVMARAMRAAGELTQRAPRLGPSLFEALSQPFAGHVGEDVRKLIRLEIATVIDFGGLCLEAVEPMEPFPSWNQAVLEARVRCYRQHDHPGLERARDDLHELMNAAPELLFPAESVP